MRTESELMMDFKGTTPQEGRVSEEDRYMREKIFLEVLLDLRGELKRLTDLAKAASEQE